jgi:DNA-binding NarL/FixJ family response regulator
LSFPVRVLIADDDSLFLDALEAILGIEAQIEIAGRAHDGDEASRRIHAGAPDTAVIVLTGSSYAEDVEKAYDAGATGYVTKDRIAQDLVRTVLSAVR